MKVGDKIEILEDSINGSHPWWQKGHIYDVTYVQNDYFQIKHKEFGNNGWNKYEIKYKILNLTNYYFY